MKKYDLDRTVTSDKEFCKSLSLTLFLMCEKEMHQKSYLHNRNFALSVTFIPYAQWHWVLLAFFRCELCVYVSKIRHNLRLFKLSVFYGSTPVITWWFCTGLRTTQCGWCCGLGDGISVWNYFFLVYFWECTFGRFDMEIFEKSIRNKLLVCMFADILHLVYEYDAFSMRI